MSLGPQELLIIFVIVLLLFGGKKIPELLRGVGKGVGELQKGLDEGKRIVSDSISSEPEKTTVPANRSENGS
ncbi:MAG: twin-arginine translocase TatA/TatE family subunit [Fimbriimonadaceae bacterium]|nr:twin-arginine translocase TatA/TatE family subunit [Fimbriimonadaceae bacterium]